MQINWLEGNIRGRFTLTGIAGSVPLEVSFLNNGAMSVTVGSDSYIPSQKDLEEVGVWASGVAKALGINDDAIVLGALYGGNFN